MGEITPTEGDVERFCEVGYLPQVFTAVPGETVAALLGIADKLRAISEIEAGAYDPSLFDMVDADWDAAERAKALLHKLDLPHIELTQQVNEVSGGELTRIAFVAILLRSPDFLVLDEPTNNLDQPARLAMRRFLKEWKGGLLVVAHDRELLADVDLILELSQGGIKSYRGNFEHPKD